MQKIIQKIKDKDPVVTALDLKIADLENMFGIFKSDQDNYFFNLNETLYLSVPLNRFLQFRPDHEMPWTLISYKLYNTPRLAWLLIRLNDVSLKNVFNLVRPGDIVRYLSKQDLNTILRTLTEN